MASLKLISPDGYKLKLVDQLARLADDDDGKEFVRRVEEYTKDWLGRILGRQTEVAKNRWSLNGAEVLLRQVFYRYANARIMEEETTRAAAIHSKRDTYARLVQIAGELRNGIEKNDFELMSYLKNMFAEEEHRGRLDVKIEKTEQSCPEDRMVQAMVGMYKEMDRLQEVLTQLQKKWDGVPIKLGHPRSNASDALAADLFRFLRTVQGSVPRIASAITVDLVTNTHAGTQARVECFEFVEQGLEIVGPKRNRDRFAKDMRKILQSIDFESDDGHLKLTWEVTEEWLERVGRESDSDDGED